MTTVRISAQYLDGNAPEGFLHDDWLDALESAYAEIAERHYPGAQVEIYIDRQRTCSGACREVSSVVTDDHDELVCDAVFEQALSYVAGELYNARADEFFA